ncbi:MAG: hypothetical protein EU529_09435 [Promethearchaeota archaeon]|nr:MAG: hypothetical protein EU529_09435 [Candidatus Lokiarchaeota archaeon]
MGTSASMSSQFNEHGRYPVLINQIELDARPGHEEEFKRNLGAVVMYMVKHSATIVVKQGYRNSLYNVLYADPFSFLLDSYMKQAFFIDSRGYG